MSAIDIWRSRIGTIEAIPTLKASDTTVTVVRYCGFEKEGAALDFMNLELFARVIEELWWTLHKDAGSCGMILTYLQTSNKLMKLIRDHLPEAVRARISCSTLDSAKGLEAAHVRIVFVPRHSENGEYDLGGLQKDPHRFFQGSMRPTNIAHLCS